MQMIEQILSSFEDVFKESLSDRQKAELEFVVTELQFRNLLPNQLAYILATVKHETANTFKPLEEYGKGKGKEYGKSDIETGKAYYGRGYVQLTWKENYKKFSELLKLDFVNCPELCCNKYLAVHILYLGMRDGLFTGKKLKDYLDKDKTDFLNARKIVNGTDKAELIKGYAEKFLEIVNSKII